MSFYLDNKYIIFIFVGDLKMGFNLKFKTCEKCGLIVVGDGDTDMKHNCKINYMDNKIEIMKYLIKKGLDVGFENAIKIYKEPTQEQLKNFIYLQIVKELDDYLNDDFIRDTYPANVPGSKEFLQANKFPSKDDTGMYGC